jgi:glycosyltransferase involved in cell wall biosynthesis
VAQLVSIAIPAYSERYFPQALASALAQRYEPLEIVVCDDSAGTAIEVAARAAGDARVRYIRNPQRLGFAGNFTRCFHEARGDLVKFLNDDDRLLPACVESLAPVLEANPAVMLATSRRRVIDERGEPRADIQATTPVSIVSALIFGRELADLALANGVNVIGEPTTAMFRRSQLAVEGDSIFRWGGRDYHCLADLALWLRLLRTGLAYYCASVLSEFRMHPEQEQERPGARFECMAERLWIAREARRAGFLATDAAWRAALASVKARADLWQSALGLDAATRRAVDAFVAELDADIAAARRP